MREADRQRGRWREGGKKNLRCQFFDFHIWTAQSNTMREFGNLLKTKQKKTIWADFSQDYSHSGQINMFLTSRP